jgi:hypothetical protein
MRMIEMGRDTHIPQTEEQNDCEKSNPDGRIPNEEPLAITFPGIA